MRIFKDDTNRIFLSDDKSAIIFDTFKNHVAVYQDSNDGDLRTALENLDVATELSKDDLIDGLETVIYMLKGRV